eukprot:m.47399 g.47399  ORF g.47399 m.47399 type:complete len:342 (-) comp7328_c0_seq2:203-1228(-)
MHLHFHLFVICNHPPPSLSSHFSIIFMMSISLPFDTTFELDFTEDNDGFETRIEEPVNRKLQLSNTENPPKKSKLSKTRLWMPTSPKKTKTPAPVKSDTSLPPLTSVSKEALPNENEGSFSIADLAKIQKEEGSIRKFSDGLLVQKRAPANVVTLKNILTAEQSSDPVILDSRHDTYYSYNLSCSKSGKQIYNVFLVKRNSQYPKVFNDINVFCESVKSRLGNYFSKDVNAVPITVAINHKTPVAPKYQVAVAQALNFFSTNLGIDLSTIGHIYSLYIATPAKCRPALVNRAIGGMGDFSLSFSTGKVYRNKSKVNEVVYSCYLTLFPSFHFKQSIILLFC